MQSIPIFMWAQVFLEMIAGSNSCPSLLPVGFYERSVKERILFFGILLVILFDYTLFMVR